MTVCLSIAVIYTFEFLAFQSVLRVITLHSLQVLQNGYRL